MTLAAEGGKDKKPVVRLSTFRNAAKHLQKAGDFRPDMLEDQPIRTLIDEITDALMEGVNIGLKDAEIPTEMADRLGRDVFVFSGCKTYHELREASQLLRDDRGRIKPFGKFFEEVRQIHPEYNERYLEAEHQFAVHSAQAAAQWAEIEREGNDYDLQYRTANDGKVRPAHAKLEGLTRPQDDPCWSEIMPPNGWKCRCRVVQVRKGKYDYTDRNEVSQLVREATTDLDSQGRNRAEMFRFNPGMDRVIFPKHHPYYNLSIQAKTVITDMADKREVKNGFAAKTIAEAEEAFRTQLGVKCRLDGFKKSDMAQVQEIFACVSHHFTDFPELRDKIKFVGSVKGRVAALEDIKYTELCKLNPGMQDDVLRKYAKNWAKRMAGCSSSTYAYSSKNFTEYALNGLAFNSTWAGTKVKKQLEYDVQHKFHPVGCDTVKAVFDHELGHKIDEMLSLYTDPDFLAIYNPAKAQGERFIADNLSAYAYCTSFFRKSNYTPQKEFIAEAWSEYRNNEKPRPLAVAVGELINRKYDAKKQN